MTLGVCARKRPSTLGAGADAAPVLDVEVFTELGVTR
jgi:hypothetical protein